MFEMARYREGSKKLIGGAIALGVAGGITGGAAAYYLPEILGGGSTLTELGINWGKEAWRVVRASRPLEKMGHAAKHLQDFQQYANLSKEEVAKILVL